MPIQQHVLVCINPKLLSNCLSSAKSKMISNFSKKVVKKLIDSGNITSTERELYEYGIFILMSNILYIVVTAILGLAFGLFYQSLLFFIVFMVIRQYAGGYHASTELKCEIFTTLCILASIITMNLISGNLSFAIILVLSAFSAVFIFVFAPIDTDEKALDEIELKVFCKRTKLVLVVIVAIIIVSLCLQLKSFCIPCCMSLILEGVLLIAGKAKKIRMGKCGET